MFRFRKYRSRRAEIRRNRPDLGLIWQNLKSPQSLGALAVAVVFWIAAAGVSTLRDQIVGARPGQHLHQDIISRVRFESRNTEREIELRQQARDAAPRVYRRVENCFAALERRLLSLPEDVASRTPDQLPRDLHLDGGTITALKTIHAENAQEYKKWVKQYIGLLHEARDKGKLIILPYEEREQDLQMPERRTARVQTGGMAVEFATIDINRTFARKPGEAPNEPQRFELLKVVSPLADQSFLPSLAANIAGHTVDTLQPTHELDRDLTAAEQHEAVKNVSLAPARRHVLEKTVLASKGSIVTQASWKLLADEQQAYIAQMPTGQWILTHAGMAGIMAALTIAMAAYVAAYQPRIVRNHARAIAIGALLLAMLVVAELAAIGTGPLLIFGIAPAILAAMILVIAYEQRFALGLGTVYGLLVTVAIGQDVSFFLIMWLGVLTCCFFLDEIRTRSKPIEVGGAAALAMMLGAAAVGALAGDPPALIGRSCLHVGAAGLGVGFVILGILPFIEKAFRITTSMTLLELADVSQPLLRRLAVEAPGTYNHSLLTATLAEAAAEAIGADPLLCRVGSYYHDIGKMNKADYFCENQFDGQNRHINLNPTVSLLIIIGHVKDGIEMAREYNLPTVLMPIIQQHHGTTLVEYFYHQACNQRAEAEPDATAIDDAQFRYPGPMPRSREAAIVMVADVAESAGRAMVDPTANRIETLVHDLIMARLLDGQFDEADMTFSELEQVERSLVKTLLGIYHSRLAYPSTAATTHGPPAPTAKSA
jgi:hypothetical protein